MSERAGLAIDLVPLYLAAESALVPELAERLAEVFVARVRVRPPWFDPEEAFDPARGQYCSTTFLHRLVGGESERATGRPRFREEQAPDRILGVAGVDLFVPILTYVFGEAQLDGPAAVVSLYRLRPERYGLPASPPLVAERLVKEAVHELGHTWGLVHCPDPECVMRASTYVEEIDFKGADFCPECAAVIQGGPAAKLGLVAT